MLGAVCTELLHFTNAWQMHAQPICVAVKELRLSYYNQEYIGFFGVTITRKPYYLLCTQNVVTQFEFLNSNPAMGALLPCQVLEKMFFL